MSAEAAIGLAPPLTSETVAHARTLDMGEMTGPLVAQAVDHFAALSTAAAIVSEELASGHPRSSVILDALGMIDLRHAEGVAALCSAIHAGHCAGTA